MTRLLTTEETAYSSEAAQKIWALGLDAVRKITNETEFPITKSAKLEDILNVLAENGDLPIFGVADRLTLGERINADWDFYDILEPVLIGNLINDLEIANLYLVQKKDTGPAVLDLIPDLNDKTIVVNAAYPTQCVISLDLRYAFMFPKKIVERENVLDVVRNEKEMDVGVTLLSPDDLPGLEAMGLAYVKRNKSYTNQVYGLLLGNSAARKMFDQTSVLPKAKKGLYQWVPSPHFH